MLPCALSYCIDLNSTLYFCFMNNYLPPSPSPPQKKTTVGRLIWPAGLFVGEKCIRQLYLYIFYSYPHFQTAPKLGPKNNERRGLTDGFDAVTFAVLS